MVSVVIENPIRRTALEHEVSRVPNVGEMVCLGGDVLGEEVFEVVSVIHRLDVDPDNEPVAIVRVK